MNAVPPLRVRNVRFVPHRTLRPYEWDHTHGNVEEYDSRGKHQGSVDPQTGEQTKPAVPGRKINL